MPDIARALDLRVETVHGYRSRKPWHPTGSPQPPVTHRYLFPLALAA